MLGLNIILRRLLDAPQASQALLALLERVTNQPHIKVLLGKERVRLVFAFESASNVSQIQY